MSLRLLVAPLALLAACGPHATHPAAGPVHPVAPTAVKPVLTENDYDAARPEYDALPVTAPDRPAQRAALERYLLDQVRRDLSLGHLDEAYEAFQRTLTLWDPSELSKPTPNEPLHQAAVQVEQSFKKRGAHEQVLLALVVQFSLAPQDQAARTRFERVTAWLRGGGSIEREYGAPIDGRGRVIDDLETAARLWPSPFVVERLAKLYFERHDAGDGAEALHSGRRPRDLRALLGGANRRSTAYDLARLYLRISRPDEAMQALGRLKSPSPADEQVIKLLTRYTGPQATANDALNVAMLMAQGHEDGDVAERVCTDATQRFPQSADPHLCAGQIAMARDRSVVAMREFEAARRLKPGQRETWQRLAQLWEQRLGNLASDENLSVSELKAQLKRVEAFHAAAAKQFPKQPIHPSLADAFFEVGRGYYNAGQLKQAIDYLQRSVALEPSAMALEQMGQIHLKKGEGGAALALFERAIALPKGEKPDEVYWRARLRRDLAEAYDLLGDAQAATNARKAALADWEVLQGIGLTPAGKAEAGLERAKLYYQLGDRDQALANIDAAIDAAPDRASTYADVIAFLIPRGELDEALDAYHRALGRNEVSDYLKVYCSLWIVDLARRANQPVDPLASSYLQSTDGGKWYDDLARWATGRESEEVLLSRANTPAKRAESSYYLAMRAVQKGDLDRAKVLWKQVVDTDMMAFFEYDMAQLFLRLGQAPAHPLIQGSARRPASAARRPEGSI